MQLLAVNTFSLRKELVDYNRYMTDLLDILRRNFITPIVIAILSLALILLILGEGRDAWFISCLDPPHQTIQSAQTSHQDLSAYPSCRRTVRLKAPSLR